jgi:hypothetical protein
MRLRADLLFDQEEVGLYFGIDKHARDPMILGGFLLAPIKLYQLWRRAVVEQLRCPTEREIIDDKGSIRRRP